MQKWWCECIHLIASRNQFHFLNKDNRRRCSRVEALSIANQRRGCLNGLVAQIFEPLPSGKSIQSHSKKRHEKHQQAESPRTQAEIGSRSTPIQKPGDCKGSRSGDNCALNTESRRGGTWWQFDRSPVVGHDIGSRRVGWSAMFIEQLRRDNHVAKLFEEAFIVTLCNARIQQRLYVYRDQQLFSPWIRAARPYRTRAVEFHKGRHPWRVV